MQEIRSLCCHLCSTLMDSKEGVGVRGPPVHLYLRKCHKNVVLDASMVGKSSSREESPIPAVLHGGS